MADKEFSVLEVNCKHCGTKQAVKFASKGKAVTGVTADIACINCKKNFAVLLLQEEIIGEPFAV